MKKDFSLTFIFIFKRINETLRLCPSVPVDFRASVSEDVLPSGFQVAPNTIMAYSAYVVHRLEEFCKIFHNLVSI